MNANPSEDGEVRREDESAESARIEEPEGVEKTIIDKLVEYVSRNGREFEKTLLKKNDNERFGFLKEGHKFYKYYCMTLEKAVNSLQKQADAVEPTKSSEKDKCEEKSGGHKKRTKVDSSSEDSEMSSLSSSSSSSSSETEDEREKERDGRDKEKKRSRERGKEKKRKKEKKSHRSESSSSNKKSLSSSSSSHRHRHHKESSSKSKKKHDHHHRRKKSKSRH